MALRGPEGGGDAPVQDRCAREASGRWLHELGLTRLQPGPVHPQKDPEAEAAFKKLRRSGQGRAPLPQAAAGRPVEIWFQDEARVGQKGGHAPIWAPVGSRPRMVRDNRHVSAYIFGAICPDRAGGVAMIMPYANAQAMNLQLQEINAEVGRAPMPSGLRRSRLASKRQETCRPRQHRLVAPAALLTRTESHGERLGLPAAEQTAPRSGTATSRSSTPAKAPVPDQQP